MQARAKGTVTLFESIGYGDLEESATRCPEWLPFIRYRCLAFLTPLDGTTERGRRKILSV
jgi:hypothetical protein